MALQVKSEHDESHIFALKLLLILSTLEFQSKEKLARTLVIHSLQFGIFLLGY